MTGVFCAAKIASMSSKLTADPGAQRIDANADAAAGCLVGTTILLTRPSPTLASSAYTCPSSERIVLGLRILSHHVTVTGRTHHGTGYPPLQGRSRCGPTPHHGVGLMRKAPLTKSGLLDATMHERYPPSEFPVR
eukprot:CAMPEP_0173405684 /NCGR_PEP_ID=MMETSP1356-20130122/62463_1 /TAXON_ID=77927 ORGANISM="Hemiselmis virescens, Strain PCC157" /NCGR_SAMPLE_ID=MMETSP1356 /ASSEMBLY_ACC=CAM_ASM_000847 /LENGTH=134 /DNA_ID=CAMNT_0014366519 /DNA_START=99 /DNA_END=503 /DNA_ORIENTATION=+